MSVYLISNLDEAKKEPTRLGFGKGLLTAGLMDSRIVALCADLTGSTKMDLFANEFPERFIQVGVAEQNLVTVASGMAAMGKVPFVSSYAAFSPGRNWEQIRTTICLNQQNVKIAGSHTGLSVGPDGATHQMLEDIALMRVLPNMIVICPADAVEAEKATLAMAADLNPNYIRLTREATPVFTTRNTPFAIGRAEVFRNGKDISLIGTGTMTYQLLVAAEILFHKGIDAEVVHVATVKPLDETTILASVRKTKRVVTAEEAQVAGGFGGAITELLSEKEPVSVLRVGMMDRFGESGNPDELMDYFDLTGAKIARKIMRWVE